MSDTSLSRGARGSMRSTGESRNAAPVWGADAPLGGETARFITVVPDAAQPLSARDRQRRRTRTGLAPRASRSRSDRRRCEQAPRVARSSRSSM